ncbi:velvet factor-domain-containing protein, partial [Neohortaea acidophila]
MIAVLVEAEPAPQGDPNDPSSTDAWKPVQGNNLLGQTVSSLHRLKDVNNADGGYFVFGDISCKRIGFYRLQFNLFDFQNGEAVFVKSTVSEPFQAVVSSKEFRGQRESTPLSRTFSDQGVRLRLRKEQRV